MTTTETTPASVQTLGSLKLYSTAHAVPKSVSRFQADVYGPCAVARVVNSMLSGEGEKVAAFAIVKREPVGPLENAALLRVIRFGIGDVEGKKCFRYCGEGGQPNGSGSSSVVATWYDDCMDAAVVTAALVYQGAIAGGELFRIQVEGVS